MANARLETQFIKTRVSVHSPPSESCFIERLFTGIVWCERTLPTGNAVMLGKRGVIQTRGQNSSVNDSYWRFPKSAVHHKRRFVTYKRPFYESWQQACARPHLRVQNTESDGALFNVSMKEVLTFGMPLKTHEDLLWPSQRTFKINWRFFETVFGFLFPPGACISQVGCELIV